MLVITHRAITGNHQQYSDISSLSYTPCLETVRRPGGQSAISPPLSDKCHSWCCSFQATFSLLYHQHFCREKRCAEDQRSSLVAAVEKAFLSGSLRKLAEGSPLSQLPPRPSSKSKSCKPDEEEDATHTVTPETGNIPTSNLHAKNAASAAKAVYIVRYLEGAARAAEQMYAKQAGNLVRLRAEAALRGGHEAIILTRKKEGIREASILPEEETGAIRSKGETERKWQRERAENVVSCGNCSFLFKANERLLQEATSRGLLR